MVHADRPPDGPEELVCTHRWWATAYLCSFLFCHDRMAAPAYWYEVHPAEAVSR